MTTTCRPADDETTDLLQEVMGADHPRLAEVGVTVLLQFAEAEGGPALKLHGYPAYAIVRVVPLKDRAAGLPDCRIAIDQSAWEEHDEGWRKALLSHELEHVAVQEDEHGNVKEDALGRPKLKLKPHDFQLGGFIRTVEKYGKEAVESQQYRDLHNMMTQLKFPWG
jgi:hypothetical protein